MLVSLKMLGQKPTLKTTSPLIGLVDHKLVQINHKDASITPYSDTNIPAGLDVRVLAYSPHDEIFYTLVNGSTEPELASISLEGEFKRIARITLNGTNVDMCEGMAYDIQQERLIAFVSLNGNKNSHDYYSETIVAINKTSAKAQKITQLNPGSTLQTDGDNICILGDYIYLHDGKPNSKSGFYNITLDNLKNNLDLDKVINTKYVPITDMASYRNTIYITTRYNLLLAYVPEVNTFVIIGDTHEKEEYNGKPIVGIDNILFQMAEIPLDEDIRR